MKEEAKTKKDLLKELKSLQKKINRIEKANLNLKNLRSEQILQSEEKYRTLFEESFEGLFISSPGGKILDINKRALIMSGYNNKEEIFNLDLISDVYINPADRQKFLSTVNSKGSAEYETCYKKKNGEIAPVVCSLVAVKNASGKVMTYMGTIRDISKQRHAEDELKRRESLMRTLINTIPDLIWVKDTDGRYIQCNRRLENLFGAKEDEIIGKSDYYFMNKEIADSSRRTDIAAINAGEPQMNEEQVTFPDGHEEILETIKAPIFGDDGICIGTLGFSHNITRRKQLEDELFESVERLKAIVEGTPHLFFYTQDTEATITYISPTVEQITGYKADIWLKRKDWFKTDAVFNQIAVERMYAHLRGESTEGPILVEVRHANGNSILLEVYEYPVIKNGILIGLHAVAHDITEQKQAENQLRRLNRELRAISKCNQTLLHSVDEQNLINEICSIICSDAGYILAWVGYKEYDEFKSVRPVAWAGLDSSYITEARITWAEDTERGRGPTGIAVRSGEISYVQDFLYDPQMIPWRESALEHGYRSSIALPLKDECGKIFGVLQIYSAEPNAFTVDEITLLDNLTSDLSFGILALRNRAERKLAENKLEKYSQELKELNAGKDKLFSIIAHDLKSPFNPLLGISELIVNNFESLSPQEIKSFNAQIYNSLKNEYELLENLLNWSRLETGQLNFTLEKINLFEKTENVINLLSGNAKLKDITLYNNTGTDVFVLADPNMLHSVLQNLIANSIKFTNKLGLIKIYSAAADNDIIKITVSDNGIGMTNDHINSLFGSSESSTKGTYNEKGTGLGLIICKGMVEKHGGTLYVESEVGNGTNISFTLPKAE
jgi:PAS domain S-box-containing protein